MAFTGASLRRMSLRDQALSVLREALVTGELVPGEVYSAASLATEFGVSTSPVREAMLALVDEGLLEALPNRGFRVVSFTERDFAEIFELRMMLEVPGVGRAAELGLGDRAERLSRLVDVIERTAEEHDLAGNLQADRDFHILLLEATGNRRLVDSVVCLRDQTRLYNLRSLTADGDLADSAAEHRPLLEAVLRGDRALAEELMRRHLSHIPGDWSSGGEPKRGPAA
ncbi:GntR family transcriptional regulator [Sphaerisporangium perillae]|uniref:GntR family transcriptional regulator n=1 Tax=Sphaerisporangium perillae TaxID=2935860 RepID=UPI00200C838C|nr:GntR family transcriptional regulator [Sphaerisporangium perillae]